ncbi:MAG: hypothetical protein KDH97_00180 [Calditrichaeota bacterium]|nr:hypothetical protein [Calditrichota bacterium]MCB0288651.1 hypothetical protein [Calditrichota bacterium]MCB0294119.1 hypothetical protein [Calditrichota bacterium]MCB0312285.1 hypothetical protein [Calditrichota bacterium]MCB9088599.1 hypothetical protein [Calditrichia bacterium]
MDIQKQADTLFEETVLKDLVQIYKLVRRKIKIGSKKWQKSFKAHFIQAMEHYSLVKTLVDTDKPSLINNIFVEPRFRLLGKEVSYNNFIKEIFSGKRIIISATGGAGKSMAMKHLFTNSVEFFPGRYPLFIELRNVEVTEEYPLLYHIAAYFRRFGLNQSAEDWDEVLKTGKFLLFLDGFDEISKKNRKQLLKSIIEFDTIYKNNGLIVATRQDEEIESLPNFCVYKLCALNKEMAKMLIQKLDISTEDKDEFIKEINKLWGKFHDFISNPMLLIIMLLTYKNIGKIHDKVHNFYNFAFIALYYRHDALKTGFYREFKSQLEYDDFRRVFAAVSAQAWLDGALSFSETKIQKYLKNAKVFTNLEFKSNDFLQDIVQSVCLLHKDKYTGLYSYFHKSFQEYFTAEYIVNRPGNQTKKNLLSIALERSKNDDVFCLAHEMRPEIVEQNFIKPKLDEFLRRKKEKNRSTLSLIYKRFKISPNIKTNSIELILQYPSKFGLLLQTLSNLRSNKSFSRFSIPKTRVTKKLLKEWKWLKALPITMSISDLYIKDPAKYKLLKMNSLEDQILKNIRDITPNPIRDEAEDLYDILQ